MGRSKQVAGVEDEECFTIELSKELVEVWSVSLSLRKELCVRGLTGNFGGNCGNILLEF